ncbi:DUF2946 domain-containing protein, partial [Burkholderia sp. Tr-20355]|uniref:DUF2946 domain-containing protein n=1 Tax=Burkholderia sp. Tr-20355 TaxID=2703895 RepID=UPI001F11F0DD
MRRTTRWIGLVWLALVLNVLSPVVGYARLASSGSGALTLELCSAAGARQVVLAQAGDDRDTSSFDHAGVPHCVYCRPRRPTQPPTAVRPRATPHRATRRERDHARRNRTAARRLPR